MSGLSTEKFNLMKQLKCFIVIGSENGSYYVNDPVKLTNMKATCLSELLRTGRGPEVVKILKDYSESGRTSKPDPILFCLAMCAVHGSDTVKTAAYSALPVVCNIPTKLFMFLEVCQKLEERRPNRKRKAGDNFNGPLTEITVNKDLKKSSGWSRRRRLGVAACYNNPKIDANQLLYYMTKYKQRNGWSHELVLRYAHVKMTGNEKVERNLVVTYCTKGYKAFQKKAEQVDVVTDSIDEIINNINVVESVSKLDPTVEDDKQRLVDIYEQYGTSDYDSETKWNNHLKKPFMLVREHIPTGFLRCAKLWEVMLQDMPMTAMLRNLGKLTALGMFDEGNEFNVSVVVSKLTLVDMLQAARVHPMKRISSMSLGKMSSTQNVEPSANQPHSVISSGSNQLFRDNFQIFAT